MATLKERFDKAIESDVLDDAGREKYRHFYAREAGDLTRQGEIVADLERIVKVLSTPEARAGAAHQAAWVKEQADAKAAAEAAAAAKVEAARVAAWDAEKAHQLIAWRGAGGTEAEFEAAWPAMRLRIIEERVADRRAGAYRAPSL